MALSISLEQIFCRKSTTSRPADFNSNFVKEDLSNKRKSKRISSNESITDVFELHVHDGYTTTTGHIFISDNLEPRWLSKSGAVVLKKVFRALVIEQGSLIAEHFTVDRATRQKSYMEGRGSQLPTRFVQIHSIGWIL